MIRARAFLDEPNKVALSRSGRSLPISCYVARLVLNLRSLEKEGKGRALIITIAVPPPFRPRGLGGQLLYVVTPRARAQGLAGVKLGVPRDNPEMGLYKAAEFAKFGMDGDHVNYEIGRAHV